MIGDTVGDLSKWKDYCYTARELADELMKLPGDTIVILEKDAEGNGYSPLSSVRTSHYEPVNTYSGELKSSAEDFDNDGDPDYTYADYIRDATFVIVLGPVN
jgi:hypothetical protein